jgi:uncharacterized phage-associated protein
MGPFQFDPEKATEALLYVARRVRDQDLYTTLKVLYLADKHHLHRYGRFIFGDAHHALPHGPVPQGAYDILKWLRGDSGHRYDPARKALRVEGNTINALRDAEIDVFSASDLECLDQAIEEFGRLPFSELKRKTHDSAYKATPPCGQIAVEAIAALSDDPVPLIQHLADPHPGD